MEWLRKATKKSMNLLDLRVDILKNEAPAPAPPPASKGY
jgi:hypothetical protein